MNILLLLRLATIQEASCRLMEQRSFVQRRFPAERLLYLDLASALLHPEMHN